MKPTYRSFSSLLLLLLATVWMALLPPQARADQRQIEDALRKDFKNKHVILRHFYVGDRLQFDSTGNLVGNVEPGYWTSDGMLKVLDVAIDKRHGRLVLRGKRIINGFDHAKCQFTNILTKRPVTIELQLDPSWQDAAPVRALIDKVIFRDTEELRNFVPDYWHDWFGGIKRTKKDGRTQCEPVDSHGMSKLPFPGAVPMAQDVESSPSRNGQKQTAGSPETSDRLLLFVEPDGTKVFKVGSAVKPPKALHTPDPDYNEAARENRYQGTTVLWVVVNERGEPKTIRIARPLGAGLDDKAVEAVEQWRFSPATHNGVPVAVQINVEMNFRLY